MDIFKGANPKLWKSTKPAKPRKKSPERDVQKLIRGWCTSRNIYTRQITSTGTRRNGKWHTSGQGKGISDLIGITETGTFVAIEVKACGKKNTLSDFQYKFLTRIIMNQGIACVADSISDVEKCLHQHKLQDFTAMQATLDQWKPKPKPEKYYPPEVTPFD